MTSIKIPDGVNYNVNGQPIVSLTVKPVGFVAYARNRSKASAGARTDAMAQRLDLRGRIKLQLRAVDSADKELVLDDVAIAALPFRVAVQVKEALTDVLFPEEAGTPEILGTGNGYTSPIHVKLGSPIKTGTGTEIGDLEFMAGTLGAMEDVLIADNDLDRTVALLSLAQPAGGPLTSLPTWAIDAISVSDGLFIMRNVTNAFYETPTSSPE